VNGEPGPRDPRCGCKHAEAQAQRQRAAARGQRVQIKHLHQVEHVVPSVLNHLRARDHSVCVECTGGASARALVIKRGGCCQRERRAQHAQHCVVGQPLGAAVRREGGDVRETERQPRQVRRAEQPVRAPVAAHEDGRPARNSRQQRQRKRRKKHQAGALQRLQRRRSVFHSACSVPRLPSAHPAACCSHRSPAEATAATERGGPRS
jgi:hypothetical protein